MTTNKYVYAVQYYNNRPIYARFQTAQELERFIKLSAMPYVSENGAVNTAYCSYWMESDAEHIEENAIWIDTPICRSTDESMNMTAQIHYTKETEKYVLRVSLEKIEKMLGQPTNDMIDQLFIDYLTDKIRTLLGNSFDELVIDTDSQDGIRIVYGNDETCESDEINKHVMICVKSAMLSIRQTAGFNEIYAVDSDKRLIVQYLMLEEGFNALEAMHVVANKYFIIYSGKSPKDVVRDYCLEHGIALDSETATNHEATFARLVRRHRILQNDANGIKLLSL